MSDRIRCMNCGAESFASGAKVVCKGCMDDSKSKIEQLLERPLGDPEFVLSQKLDEAREVAVEYLDEWLYMVAMRDGIRAALECGAEQWKRYPWLGVELSREPDQKGE